MVFCQACPQCGQVSIDSRMMVIAASLLHGERVARVGRGVGQRFRLGLVRVIGDGGCFFVEIDLYCADASYLLQRFLYCDRAQRASHVLDGHATVFDGAACAANGKATSRAMSTLRIAISYQ